MVLLQQHIKLSFTIVLLFLHSHMPVKTPIKIKFKYKFKKLTFSFLLSSVLLQHFLRTCFENVQIAIVFVACSFISTLNISL